MRDKLKSLDATIDPLERVALVSSLVGMTTNALAIYPAGTEPHQRAAKRKQWLHAERLKLQKLIEDEYDGRQARKHIINSEDVPWV